MEQRSINFAQVFAIVTKVMSAVEVLKSEEFAQGAADVLTNGQQTVEAAAKLAYQVLEVFGISPKEYEQEITRGRAIVTAFEQAVIDAMGGM